MCNASIHPCKFKAWVIPITRLIRARFTERAFAELDARARRHGWQVTPTHGGFGRCYRDPRFDRRSAPTHDTDPDPESPGHA